MANSKSYPQDSIILLIWIITGFISWYISIYFFNPLVLPIVPPAISFLENLGTPELFLITSNVLLSHISEYVLSFIFALALSYFSKATKSRIIGFIFAANAVSLYYHLLQLFGYTKHYSNLPTSAIIWIIQGLISILVISPLFAIIGSLIGNRIKRSARKNRWTGLFVVF